MTEPLELLTLPLQGSRLIEASAGTGKTWTIAALVVRLVLGHGACVRAGERPLLPAEILVMTFTRAATRELSDRIRQRLAAVAAVFRGLAEPAADDHFLGSLLAAYPAGAAREAAAWRLACAAEAMDAAAVLTIDAWCQRTLREHALERGLGRDDTVQPDSLELRSEAARDYWRQQVYPLEGDDLRAVQSLWASPDRLVADLRDLAEKPLPDGAADGTLAGRVEAWRRRIDTFKAPWPARIEQMRDWLEAQTAGAAGALEAQKLNRRNRQAWLAALSAWAEDPLQHLPAISAAGERRLTPDGLREAGRPGRRLEIPELFVDFEALMRALRAEPSLPSLLRLHAAACVEARAQQLKAQRQLLSHHDVQVQLAEALDPALGGERARVLRERVLARYPVALVDEFQDTSPLQLAILDRLYRIAVDDPATALLLIGDPKQSIYAFRGADIHSYLRARRATEGRHHALGVNFRSAAGLVEAVNALFGRAEARAGEGAFRFGSTAAMGAEGENPVPFEPVRARGLGDTLEAEGAPLPPMTVCVTPWPMGATDARQWYAQRCAQLIVDLLNRPQTGFRDAGNGAWKPLVPGDIAVLVRSRHEAVLVREALEQRGLPSVFLSDRDSVFATAEAADLARVLRAIVNPGDARLVRAAVATALIGHTLPELIALADDEERFDAAAERLRALQAVWQQRGVLAMVRELLHGHGLPSRWLGQRDGERRLTDVLHLSELLQQAAAGLDGESALLRWLEREIAASADESTAAEEQVLRLESDADRVQVVTVHKSKGLQYPLVFVPFATQVRDERSTRHWALWVPDDDGRRRLVVDPEPAAQQRAALEAQREDLRLLYVALTRAQYRLWIGAAMHHVGHAKTPAWPRSAFGSLVSGTELAEPQQLLDELRALAACGAGIDLHLVDDGEAASPGGVRGYGAPPRDAEVPPAPPYSATFDGTWAIGSYSALVRDAGRSGDEGAAPEAAAVDGLVAALPLREDEALAASVEVREAADDVEAIERSATAPWHRFPRGALAGDFLHRQLEWLADEGFERIGTPAVQRALALRCEREGFGARALDAQRWLERICSQTLPPLGVALAALRGCLAEMEFWLPGDGLDAQRLDALCRARLWPGEPRPALVPRQLHGLLMGFADLVFAHEGRFWVLDYKSNALGPTDADYDAPAMQRAMLKHRYDVQAVLYLLALHRLLRARLGGAYRPDEQLGGALVLFVRGIAGQAAGCCAVAPPLALLDELDRTLPAAIALAPGDDA